MKITREENDALEQLGQALHLGAATIDVLIKLFIRLIKNL